MRFLIIFMILISTPCLALTNDAAAQLQKQSMQNFLNTILQHRESPWGVTALSMVAQCKNNPPIIIYGGFTSIDYKTPINENSLFPIASNTKSFIAVVILQLAQEYKLDLDNPNLLKKYFPEYPKWEKITPRQLLNMTSGIPGTNTGEADDIFRNFTKSQYESYISQTDILNKVYQFPLHFKPGTQWEYSNTNYILLGQLIEKITGHTAKYEVQKRIIDPLKLQHTYFPTDRLESIPGVNQSDIVHGYAYYPKKNGLYHPYSFITFGQDTINFSMSHTGDAGAIVSTPKDINIYLHALFQSNKLLNKSQFKEFTALISRKNSEPFLAKKFPEDFGFGLGVFGSYSKTQNTIIYFYQGSLDGYQYYFFYNPKNKMYLTFGINTRSDIIWKNNSLELFDILNKQCK